MTSRMTPEQITRYRRQISLFGTTNQEKVLAARVAVLGAGGLGSPALLYLAGAGVGRITLIDDDHVDLSNLHRQVIHQEAGVGAAKANSAAAQLHALNPSVQVDTVTERLTWDNAVPILRGADLVLDGTDNFDTRHIASHACARLGIPHVWASILGYEAQLSVFWAGHGPVYEDVFPAPPGAGVVPNCAQAGVLGPVVGVVGSVMAMEALKLITGVGEPLVGKLGYYDSLAGTWEYIPVVGSPAVLDRVLHQEPPRQHIPDVAETDEVPAGAVLIDVREPDEHTAFALPDSVNVPLPEILGTDAVPPSITAAVDGGSGPVVLYCAGGVRSARAVEALTGRGVESLLSLRGGIDRWLEERAGED